VLAVWLQWDDVDRAVDQLLDEKSDRIDTVLHGRRVTLRPGMSMAEFAAIATA
jgi:hypothetical protein